MNAASELYKLKSLSIHVMKKKEIRLMKTPVPVEAKPFARVTILLPSNIISMHKFFACLQKNDLIK